MCKQYSKSPSELVTRAHEECNRIFSELVDKLIYGDKEATMICDDCISRITMGKKRVVACQKQLPVWESRDCCAGYKQQKEATMKKEGLTFMEAVQALVDGKCTNIKRPGTYAWRMGEPISIGIGILATDWQLVDPAPTPEDIAEQAAVQHACVISKDFPSAWPSTKGFAFAIIQALRDAGMLREGR